MKKKKHPLACAAMIVAVAAAIPLGINRSLAQVREEAAGEYYYDAAGYALYEGIEKRREAASDLITVAERYVEQEPSLEALIDELDYRVQASANAYDEDDTFTRTVRANQALDAPARELAQALQGVSLAEKDQKYPAQLIDRMASEQDKLERSSYNDAAREFNARVARLRPMALLGSMATFDQDVGVEETGAGEFPDAPVPPAAPEAPDAPDLDDVLERAQQYAEDTVEGAGDFAGEAAEWADQFSDDMAGWADRFSDQLADQITTRVTEALGG